MASYRTVDGDMVDAIAHRHYGTSVAMAEAIFEANRGLAEQGCPLPGGVLITLPDISAPASVATPLRLWD